MKKTPDPIPPPLESRAKKPYQAPKLRYLGSARELTGASTPGPRFPKRPIG
jgi:hypothetical protein